MNKSGVNYILCRRVILPSVDRKIDTICLKYTKYFVHWPEIAVIIEFSVQSSISNSHI